MPALPGPDPGSIDLLWIGSALWRRRLAVLIAALVFGALGLAAGIFSGGYSAQAFLQLSFLQTASLHPFFPKAEVGGADTAAIAAEAAAVARAKFRVSLAEYKALAAKLDDWNGFIHWVSADSRFGPALAEELRSTLSRGDVLAQWVRPVYAFSRADLKDVPQQQIEEANFVVAVEILVAQRSPERALAAATAVGEYVRDSAILERASNVFGELSARSSMRVLELEREVIARRLELKLAGDKQSELEAIRSRYPEAPPPQSRQVVAIDRGSSRFLPPVTQLVGVEAHRAELEESVRLAEWQLANTRAVLSFLDPAQVPLRSARSGQALFAELDALFDRIFDGKSLSSDVVRDAYNRLRAEVVAMRTLFEGGMRFVSGPTLNEPSLVRRGLPTVIGLIVGAVLAGLAVLIHELGGPRSAAGSKLA